MIYRIISHAFSCFILSKPCEALGDRVSLTPITEAEPSSGAGERVAPSEFPSGGNGAARHGLNIELEERMTRFDF